MKNNTNYRNENTNAICSLDFSTAFDAYNYAMAHRPDINPLAVAIKSDARGTDFLHSLAMNLCTVRTKKHAKGVAPEKHAKNIATKQTVY